MQLGDDRQVSDVAGSVMDKAEFDRELRKLDKFAQAGYFLALHIRFTSPLMLYQTYDKAWIDHYSEQGYVLRDPMTAWSFTKSGTTRWSNPGIPDPFGIFEEARQFGLRFGATISTGPILSRTVCSMPCLGSAAQAARAEPESPLWSRSMKVRSCKRGM